MAENRLDDPFLGRSHMTFEWLPFDIRQTRLGFYAPYVAGVWLLPFSDTGYCDHISEQVGFGWMSYGRPGYSMPVISLMGPTETSLLTLTAVASTWLYCFP